MQQQVHELTNFFIKKPVADICGGFFIG